MTNRRRSSIYDNEYDELLDELLEDLPDDAAMRRRMAVLKQWEHPNAKQNASERVSKHWQNDDHRKKMSAAHRARWADDNQRLVASQGQKSRYENAAEREKTSASIKKLWENDPEFRKKSVEGLRKVAKTEEYRAKLSEGVTASMTPERRAEISDQMTGENSHRFKGALIGTNIADGSVVKIYGMKDAKAKGFTYQSILQCVNKQCKKHKGYTWERETRT